MSQEETKIDMTPNYEAIPFAERVEFQRILIPRMIPDYELQSKIEQHRLAFEWADKDGYAKKVSDIIDNINNKEIRELILNHEYMVACELIISIIHNDEETAHAA